MGTKPRRCKPSLHSPTCSRRFLPLGLLLPSLGDALQNVLPILIQLQLGDDDFGRMNRQLHGLAVGLLAHQAFNVDNVFEPVHRHDLALAPFVRAARHQDLVVFADGDGADLVGLKF